MKRENDEKEDGREERWSRMRRRKMKKDEEMKEDGEG